MPGSFSTGGETGRYLYAFDGYPSPSSTPPDWGYFGTGGATGGSTASPNTPGFEAEFGGGWFDCWGGAEFAGQGYAGARASRDAVYERRFYLTNLANGIKLQNVYMTFGGTSWGWLPAPVVYTSYDYGAALDEARNQTSKLVPMKQIGLMLESVPDLAELDRAATSTASSTSVKTYHLTNPATGAHFYFLRNDSSSTVSAVTLPVTTSAGTLTVPAAGGGMRLPGKDMKVLATGIKLGHRTLLYATAQPMYPGDDRCPGRGSVRRTHRQPGRGDAPGRQGASGDGARRLGDVRLRLNEQAAADQRDTVRTDQGPDRLRRRRAAVAGPSRR